MIMLKTLCKIYCMEVYISGVTYSKIYLSQKGIV